MGEQHTNGSRVSRHRLVADATVGAIANPMSGRDIRRLVASAAVFPTPRRPAWSGWSGTGPGQAPVRRFPECQVLARAPAGVTGNATPA
jgi:hypothetical protein